MGIDVFMVIVVVVTVYLIVVLKVQYEIKVVPLKVVPLCSNTVYCKWKDVSK